MSSKYVSVDGTWTVEVITLAREGAGRQRMRVSHHGYLVAYCSTINEVATYIDLALLVPADDGS